MSKENDCLKKLQRLEQKYPSKNCEAGQCAAVYDTVAGELGIRPHLLRHGKSCNSTGRGKYGDERDEFHTPEAECDRECKHNHRHKDQTRYQAKDKLAQVLAEASTTEGSPEDDKCHGCRSRRDLCHGFQHGGRDRQLRETTESPCDRTHNHRIQENAAQDRQEIEPSAAKGLENEHAEDVVERNDRSDHHRWYSEHRIAENIADERDAHEHEVAAKNRLDHRPAPCIVRLNPTDDDTEDKRREEHTARAEKHQFRLKRRSRIGDIDVVEHHEEEEHLEHHAVHMQEFLLREQTRPLYKNAHGHQAEQGDDAAKRDKKIAEHKKSASPSIVLYYNRKGQERQRIKARPAATDCLYFHALRRIFIHTGASSVHGM